MSETTTDRQRPMTPRQKRILIVTGLVALLIVSLIVILVLRLRHKPEAESEVTPVVSVKVAKAEKSEIAAEVVAVGTVWPRDKAEVAAKISAQIKSMGQLKNKLVKAGEVIAVLEARDLQTQRAEALAAVNEAKANERQVVTGTIPQNDAEDQRALRDAAAKVANTRATYERRKALFEKGGISQKDLEASQLEYETAQNELRLAQERIALRTKSLNPNDRALAAAKTAQAVQHLATLDAQLSYATIRAPITGIVTDQFQYEGEFAAAGGKLVTIADISQVIVKVPFSDTAVAELKVGDSASVTPTDTSAEEMNGQVKLLSRSSDPTNRTVEVWVTLANGAGTLRANGAAQVKVLANAKRDAIVVPTSAVSLEASNSDEGTVMVVDAQSVAHETKVTVGTKTKDKVEIVSGLNEGDTVVIEGNFALADGTKVEVAAPEEEKKDEEDKP
ncbi:MAG TPA: efflux RND transporter periplasmic adaptor subunit [Pyrinomonadaceae bacterium]